MSVMVKKSIEELQEEIVDEFSFYEDNMGKYEYIIEMGKELPGLDEKYKIEENRIKGCQSKVWIQAEKSDGKVILNAESDAFIVSGLISMLLRIYSGQKAEDIIQSDTDFIKEIGLIELLSPTRANGFESMFKQIKFYAIAFQQKED